MLSSLDNRDDSISYFIHSLWTKMRFRAPHKGVIAIKMFPMDIRRVGACPHRKHGSL